MFETTFQREATSDLTGERGSLMGAIQGLLLAQYEVLRENGHTPSEAFNETVEELTQSLMPLFAKNGMDWMYANCSTTAQRGALDWMTPFHDAIKPVVQKLYASVKSGNEAQISIDSNSKPDYRENLTAWIKAGVFCVGMGSKLFPKDKVAAEDWAYVTAKCEEALGYIAEARK